MTDNRTPPPPQLGTPETEIQAAAARYAWGFAHHSEKMQHGPLTWPDEAQHIFDGIKTGLTTAILPSLSGFKTIREKAPANMAFALISALEDGFLSLKSVSQYDQACNYLDLLEGTLNCTTHALEMIRTQAENDFEERFARQLTHRVNFAEKTLKQLREFVK
jgi:hypothetical protein